MERMRRNINFYVDGILVDETVIAVADVVGHLKKFGLTVEIPESIEALATLRLK